MHPVAKGPLDGVVACYGREKVIRGILRLGLGRIVDLEAYPLHYGFQQPRRDRLARQQRLGGAPDQEVACRVLCGVPYSVRQDPRLRIGGGATGFTSSLLRALSKKGAFVVASSTLATPMSSPLCSTSTRSDSNKPSTPRLEAQ